MQPSKYFCLAMGKILRPSLEVTRETATYNWPWVNTVFGRYTPTGASSQQFNFFANINLIYFTGCLHTQQPEVTKDGVFHSMGMSVGLGFEDVTDRWLSGSHFFMRIISSSSQSHWCWQLVVVCDFYFTLPAQNQNAFIYLVSILFFKKNLVFLICFIVKII